MREYKVILKNFVGSYLMKRHYFLMLLIFPFLVRTIGIEQYGILEFCKSISYYFTIFINYGFNYSATQQIVESADDSYQIGRIVSSTYMGKACLLFISCIILTILLLYVPILAKYKLFMLAFFALAIGSAATPGFLYQGLNKIDWLVTIDFGCRSLFLIAVFIFIRNPSQTLLYPIFYAISDILRAIISMVIAYTHLGVKPHTPTFAQVKDQLMYGLNIFISNLCRTIYDRLPQAVLGLTLDMKTVGIYVIGTKVIGEINMCIYQVMQAIFPIVSKKIKQNVQSGCAFIKSFTLKVLLVLIPLCGCLFLFSTELISFIAKKAIPESAFLLKICASLPIIIYLYTICGNGILIPLGHGKQNSYTLASMSILATFTYIFLIPIMQATGVVCSILVAEIITLILIAGFSIRVIRG
jgi:PST family polysaccharide transporter